jgi:hypothetical protein
VATSENKGMHADQATRIDSHAASTLRYIRASMDAAASVAVPGSTAIAAGSVGLLAALVASLPDVGGHWLIVWLVAAVVAGGIGSVLLLRHAPADALTISGSPIRKFAVSFLPSLAAGAVLTGVHWTNGNLQAVPGTWLILYGCALLAASATTTQPIGSVGGGFFALGAIGLFAPMESQMILLGIGFGVLHILLGYLIGFAGDVAPKYSRSRKQVGG